MQTINTIKAERKAFDAMLPQLIAAGHANKHALVKDGSVRSFHESAEDAYRAGVTTFGSEDPFLVACVAPPTSQAASVSWQLGVMLVTQG